MGSPQFSKLTCKKARAENPKYIRSTRSKWVLVTIIVAIILCSGFFAIVSVRESDVKILEIGTFVILSITLIALVFYAFDTNRMASVAQSRLERESTLDATYAMLSANDPDNPSRILFRIHNPSTLIIKAKVWAEFKVYGIRVDPGKAFNGADVWVVFPQQVSQGWYEISRLLEQQGKDPEKMKSEFAPANRESQLTLDLTIEFRDELGNRRKLPTRKHFFDFKAWRWIPVLTTKNGWDA